MADFIAKAVNGGALTEFNTVPVELAASLSPGQYDLRPIGGPVQRVTVLDVQNTVAPTVSGTPSPGNTLTGTNGTWTGVLDATTPYERRWLDVTTVETVISGATAATFDIPASGYEGKLLAFEVRAQNARGQWSGWARSAVVTVLNLTFNITNAEWTWAEDASDAQTRQGYAALTLLSALPAGKVLRLYRGSNPAGNSAQTSLMTGSGLNWTFDAATTVGVGVRDYAAIYMQDSGGTGPITQISSIKYFDASNVPSKPGAHTAVAGTLATGDVVIDPNNTPPAANGRAITGYGYSVDGGAVIAMSGGTAVTARTVTISSTVPVQTRVHAQNVNGWSVGSDPVTVTPPVITAGVNTKPPELSANLYGGGQWAPDFGEWTGNPTLTGELEQSDTGSGGWTTYAAATREGGRWPVSSLAAKYMRLKVIPSSGTPAYSPVIGPLKAGFNRTAFHWQPRQLLYQDATSPADFTLENGIWLTALLYFDGTSWNGMPFGIGQSTAGNPTNNALNCYLGGPNMRSAGGSVLSFAAVSGYSAGFGTPSSPGWYRLTYWFYRSAGVVYSRLFRNEETPTWGSVTNSALNFGSMALRFTLFGRASLTTGDDLIVSSSCDYAFGIGNPTDLHAYLARFQNGAYGAVADYNFSGDQYGCQVMNAWRVAELNPASWSPNTQITNIAASPWVNGAWTLTNTGGTNTSWSGKTPGYIDGASVVPFVPEAYISPKFGTTEDTYSIQTGKMGETIPSTATWVSGRAYAIGERVLVSGTISRCRVPHLSGATFAGDSAYWTTFTWTVNSLTHSVLGDLLPSVYGGFFTCATAGTLTASVTCGSFITPAPSNWVTNTSYSAPATLGASGSRITDPSTGQYLECAYSHISGGSLAADIAKGYWRFQYGTITLSGEVFAAAEMPTTPRQPTLFGGNALVCALEQYPTSGSGSTYASVSALATAIGAMTPGSTLTVNDLGDFSTTLTIQPADYGGAVVECKNIEGVKLANLFLNGCSNLTVRGFAVQGGIFSGESGVSGSSTTGNVIEHCRCANVMGYGVSASTSTITVRNVLGWDTEVETGRANAGYNKFVRFNRLRMERCGWGRSSSLNVLVVTNIRELIINRLLLWQGITFDTSNIHADLMQTVPASGAENVFSGMIKNVYFHDTRDGVESKSYQGMFLTDNNMKDMLVKNVVSDVGMTNGLTISGNLYNVRVEDNTCATRIGVNRNQINASWVRNNVMNVSSTILNANSDGLEETTLALPDAGVGMATIYPSYGVYPGNWRRFANPGAGYTTRGAATMLAALEAKRVALGI